MNESKLVLRWARQYGMASPLELCLLTRALSDTFYNNLKLFFLTMLETRVHLSIFLEKVLYKSLNESLKEQFTGAKDPSIFKSILAICIHMANTLLKLTVALIAKPDDPGGSW